MIFIRKSISLIEILDVLKHACRMYVMKYLTTIRNVFSKCHHSETDEDCFVNDDNPSKNENYRQSDLM
jgi:hypothetical protein